MTDKQADKPDKTTDTTAKTTGKSGDKLPNATDGDPNYTYDVGTLSESEADEAEKERNQQLAEAEANPADSGPHYNAHLDTDGPGGMASANERTDGQESPSLEERTGTTDK